MTFKRIGDTFDTEDSATSVSDALFLAISGGLFYLEHFLRSKGVKDLVFTSNYGFENVTSASMNSDTRILSLNQ